MSDDLYNYLFRKDVYKLLVREQLQKLYILKKCMNVPIEKQDPNQLIGLIKDFEDLTLDVYQMDKSRQATFEALTPEQYKKLVSARNRQLALALFALADVKFELPKI